MVILVSLIFIFSIIQLVVVAINFVDGFHLNRSCEPSNEFVSILIPARNEEGNISNLLSDLLRLNHQSFEVIIFDDQSTDQTQAIISRFVNSDSRFKLIESQGLPDGWLGKNYGCYCLSKEAKGSLLLFLDADVRIKPDSIDRTLTILRTERIQLLSIFPKQIMRTIGEWAVVPNMNHILLTLLPLRLVKDSNRSSLAAANGQFMMFDAAAYRELNPHKLKYNCRVEDIEIARLYKEKGLKVACMVDDDMVECRMYSGFNEAVMGFSKNVKAFFGNSTLLGILFWLITSMGWIALWLLGNIHLFITYLLVLVLTRVLFSVQSKQVVNKNLIFWIPQIFSLGFILAKASLKIPQNRLIWKGREV